MSAAILAAVITNIVATVGFVFQVNSRIDTLATRLDALATRIDTLGARLDARLDMLGDALVRHLEGHPH